MKIGIIGNRKITDKKRVIEIVDAYTTEHCPFVEDSIVFLLGGASGVQDIVAEHYLTDDGYDKVLFKPWHLVDFNEKNMPFHNRLFYMRNKQIIDNADRMLFITDGTADGEIDHGLQYAQKVKAEVTDEVTV